MSRLRQLGRDSVVYGLGAILAKGIGFFLLPIYTRIFSPADYGAIELLTVIAAFLSAFLVMGMDSAQSFYFFEQKDQGPAAQARLVGAILQWRLAWGCAIVVLATAAAPLLNAFFFDGRLDFATFAAAFAGALFMQLMSQSVEIFRLLYRPWPYVLVTLGQSLGAALLVLLLVIVGRQGVLGYFLGTLLASIVAAAWGWYLVRDRVDLSRLHRDWWPRLLRFGAPLVPAGIAMYVMSTCDRWFVQHYRGEADLGVYAVGAKFALVMALAIETFRRAWWPIAMDAMHSADGPETFRAISRLFMGIGVASVVYLAFLAPWLVDWLAAPPFHDAWQVVGPLAWPSLFYGFYLVASAGLWKAEKTRDSMLLMAAAAVLNVALNRVLVPSLGGLGAAIATAIAYLALVAATLVASERLWRVGFPIGLFAVQIGAGAAMVAELCMQPTRSLATVVLTHAVVAALLYSALDGRARSALLARRTSGV
jgi:O-antigen/teichoic acid export membrane protein